MDALALLPGLAALLMLRAREPEKVFLNVYLPVLLLLPEYFKCVLAGLPDPSLNQAAILPIGAVVLWKARFRLSWSLTDAFVGGFAIWACWSEYVNSGYAEAQNLGFDMLTYAVLPYLLGKELIEPRGIRQKFARRYIFLLFLVAMTSVYEFRFGRNPFRLGLAALIPEAGDGGWTTQMRWGFGRISGPYGHSILAGVIMLIGFLLNRWLIASGSWERDFKRLPGTPLKKSLIIELGLIAGVLMTMSRGPWISGIFAISTAAIGTARNARRAMVLGGIFVSLAGIATYTYTAAYTSGGRAGAQTQDQENAAYRAELLTIYEPLVMQRPVFGWGRTASDQAAWPVIDGMVSIDNYYLLVALTHGLGGLAFFALGLIVLLVRLLRAGLERGVNLQDRSLRFALAGVLVAIIVSLGTVYLGTQLYPIVFLMMGWAEGAVIFRSSGGAAETVSQERRGYRFERVYA